MDKHTRVTSVCELQCLGDGWSCHLRICFIFSVRFKVRCIEQIPVRAPLPGEVDGVPLLR